MAEQNGKNVVESGCYFCGESVESLQTCKDCGLFVYCTPLHLGYHKNPTDNSCMAFKVQRNDTLGRYTVAIRDIKPFEAVLADSALAVGPRCDESRPACLTCLNFVDCTTLCQFCNMPMCNSKECLESPIHEPECLVLREHKPNKITIIPEAKFPHPVYGLVAVLRLISLKKSNPERWGLAMALESHLEDRRVSDKKWEWVEAIALPFLRACGLDDDDVQDCERMLGVTRTNAVALPRLLANENEPMGHALFPIFSIIAHNCGANCRYVCSKDGRTVTVRAMRKISKGEDLTIDYKDPLIGNFARRKAFLDHWRFNCQCVRCSDPTEMDTYLSAVRCPDNDGYLLPKDPLDYQSVWGCDKCGKEETAEEVEKKTADLKEIGNKMSLAVELQKWEEYLLQLQSSLHPNHYIAMNIKYLIIQLLGTKEPLDTVEKLKKKVKLCENYFEVYNKVNPGYSKWRGRIMEHLSSSSMKLCQCLLDRGDIDQREFMDQYKKSILMLKDAAKCRQFEPDENHMFIFGFSLKEHNDAMESFKPVSPQQ